MQLRTGKVLLLCAGVWVLLSLCFSCRQERCLPTRLLADSLNRVAYELRYKNLDSSCAVFRSALALAGDDPSARAQALNGLGFCAFMYMDFEGAERFFHRVYQETNNELECLVADIGMMKICQRTAMNKEFYDYRNNALRRMRLIDDDRSAIVRPDDLYRLHYACSEFSIASAIYYYYLQQEQQALEAIGEIVPAEVLEGDTAQLLYYYYMRGSGGMYEADTPEEVVAGEFGFLLDGLFISHEQGYTYFEANTLQALAELLKEEKNYQLLLERRPGMMRVLNGENLSWKELVMELARNALRLFKQYGDWYQISGTYRTLASCCNEQGQYEEALGYLNEALAYVNLHHEKYYHCTDTADRLRPYIPQSVGSTELHWIGSGGIKTVPEWIARFREQLSVTYAALGMKQESDYNRNIYLDLLDYTRQDKELESRYLALERESDLLTGLLVVVVAGVICFAVLCWVLNRRWRMRNGSYIGKLSHTLDICRRITASVPDGATEVEDVTCAILENVKADILQLVNAADMEIRLQESDAQPVTQVYPWNVAFALDIPEQKQPIGKVIIYSMNKLKRDDRALMKVITPYIAWTVANGLTLISLDDERRRLEKEQYVHEQHVIENKRQNVVKKACLFIVTGIIPYIDRIVNEVHKLTGENSSFRSDAGIKKEKYRYMYELVNCINEYNDILALWIKMRQGTLSLAVSNFPLNDLLDIVSKRQRNFELKQQQLVVDPTTAVVKADKALTLFMINTLMENARKYTQWGGHIHVFASEAEDYVEISVKDDGPGLPEADVRQILAEKIYDSSKIGMQTAQDAVALQKSKGSGFGLMNCKGIIEKYRKTNALFRVCMFGIDSVPGQGSRFYFRLPKGTVKAIAWAIVFSFTVLAGCTSGTLAEREQPLHSPSPLLDDSLLVQANVYANRVYDCNVDGLYQDALFYADSALGLLNAHYGRYSDGRLPLLALQGEGNAVELKWFDSHFETDYYTLLDVRNESAVAFLALGDLEAYKYNNNAYTALYKQISKDVSLEQYCNQMQLSANNKIVAIILCFALLLAGLVGYYLLYLRHRLAYRYNLEQVFDINCKAFMASLAGGKAGKSIADCLVDAVFQDLNELLPIDVLGISVWSEETHSLHYAFSSVDEDREVMCKSMAHCFETQTIHWTDGQPVKSLPLWIEVGGENRCTGVMSLKCSFGTTHEDDRLMAELVASYVAIIVYNAVVLVSRKQRSIETAQDEARRTLHEENQLHVQNLVLDNCLSTIKHETIYYPNKIKQVIDRLDSGLGVEEERQQMEVIGELVDYYKEIFMILTSCAMRQLEDITFRRTVVWAKTLADHVTRYQNRLARRTSLRVDLKVEYEDVAMLGDGILLKFLLENLLNEAMTYPVPGTLELHIYKVKDFVRFDFTDRRRNESGDTLNQLFYPSLSRMRQGEDGGVPVGAEYLVCKQVIRDHDEYVGRRGCRMNAQSAEGGGFTVWFTIPIAERMNESKTLKYGKQEV